LIDAGNTVRVFDPRAEAMAPLVRRGGIATASPREAVTGVEIAFACLPTPEVAARLRSALTASTARAAHLCRDVDHRLENRQGDCGRTCQAQHRGARLAGKRRPRGARAGTLATMVSATARRSIA